MEERMIKNAIVTGPTGAVGTALVCGMAADGVNVYAIVRPGSQRTGELKKRYRETVEKNISCGELHIIECALSDYRELPKMVPARIDIFYHLAWADTIGDGRNDTDAQWKNIGYALDAAGAAESVGCRCFIGAGSQAEYGRCSEKLTEKTPAFPENGYGAAKLCAGQLTRIKCGQAGIDHIWTRILSVYGPGDGSRTMIMGTISKLLAHEEPALTAGTQLWDYLYSEDAAKALYLLGRKGKNGRTYCIGSGEARPLHEYVEILRDSIDPALPLGIGKVPYGDKQVMNLQADITPLCEDTGFRPSVEFEKGIADTIDWVRNNMGEHRS